MKHSIPICPTCGASLPHDNPMSQEYHERCRDYTVADATALHTMKNQLREITKLLDTTQKVYPDSIEVRSVRHELTILLSELKEHGIMPREN